MFKLFIFWIIWTFWPFICFCDKNKDIALVWSKIGLTLRLLLLLSVVWKSFSWVLNRTYFIFPNKILKKIYPSGVPTTGDISEPNYLVATSFLLRRESLCARVLTTFLFAQSCAMPMLLFQPNWDIEVDKKILVWLLIHYKRRGEN